MDETQVLAIAALADPTRRRAYEMIARAAEPVGRDEVATALDIGRPLAAFHLDKLAVGAGRPHPRRERRCAAARAPGTARADQPRLHLPAADAAA